MSRRPSAVPPPSPRSPPRRRWPRRLRRRRHEHRRRLRDAPPPRTCKAPMTEVLAGLPTMVDHGAAAASAAATGDYTTRARRVRGAPRGLGGHRGHDQGHRPRHLRAHRDRAGPHQGRRRERQRRAHPAGRRRPGRRRRRVHRRQRLIPVPSARADAASTAWARGASRRRCLLACSRCVVARRARRARAGRRRARRRGARRRRASQGSLPSRRRSTSSARCGRRSTARCGCSTPASARRPSPRPTRLPRLLRGRRGAARRRGGHRLPLRGGGRLRPGARPHRHRAPPPARSATASSPCGA